jgi:hypothetical protein
LETAGQTLPSALALAASAAGMMAALAHDIRSAVARILLQPRGEVSRRAFLAPETWFRRGPWMALKRQRNRY